MDRHDAGVAQPRDHPGLGEEALGDRAVNREIGVHHLHRHGPVERGVAREEDHAHAAVPEFALEPVMAAQCRLQAGHEFGGGGHKVQARSGVGSRPTWC